MVLEVLARFCKTFALLMDPSWCSLNTSWQRSRTRNRDNDSVNRHQTLFFLDLYIIQFMTDQYERFGMSQRIVSSLTLQRSRSICLSRNSFKRWILLVWRLVLELSSINWVKLTAGFVLCLSREVFSPFTPLPLGFLFRIFSFTSLRYWLASGWCCGYGYDSDSAVESFRSPASKQSKLMIASSAMSCNVIPTTLSRFLIRIFTIYLTPIDSIISRWQFDPVRMPSRRHCAYGLWYPHSR